MRPKTRPMEGVTVPVPCTAALDLPQGVTPDPGEFIRAAMAWHFSPETGSPFWLRRAKTLDFDPRLDVTSFDDLTLFPNVTDELREVPVADLIPAGFGPSPEVVSVIESGGTTGAPKRLPLLREFADRMVTSDVAGLRSIGLSAEQNWLMLLPSGPHGALEQGRRTARALGALVFAVDMDPRWVKKQLAAGNAKAADEYAEHIVDQAAFVLHGQDVAFLRATAPVLARIARRDDLVELIREKVSHISWGGASMDADSRYLYRTEVFPGARLTGGYGTTMALGTGGTERPGLSHDDPCIFDPAISPYTTFRVIDPATGELVGYGERGQLVVSHISKSFLLPNNSERDTALRIEPAAGQIGDSVADISPLAEFGGTAVIEGVY
jgi:phenylacetate-coenzyme A ligase PaaK-like adenylate-forming protein